MKGTDKFLIAIVAGVVLLVIVVIVVVLLRPEPEYVAGDTPQGIVHNYLLALQKGDYERAVETISASVKHAPNDENELVRDINECSWRFRDLDRDTTLIVVSTDTRGDRSDVQVKQTIFYGGDVFRSNLQEREFVMMLEQQNGDWKLIDGERYWCSCWNDIGGCE